MDSEKEFDRLIQENEKELKKNFKANFETQQKTLEIFQKGIKHAKQNNFSDTKLIWNIAGFINITSLDLKIIAQDLAFAKTNWQKNFYSRQACLIIYETINDLFDLLGKKFRRVLKSQIDDLRIEEELNEQRKKLNEFKKNHFKELKKIRNIAIAHRDQDILIQIKKIEEIQRSEIFNLVFDFDEILNGLAKVMKKVIDKGLKDFEEISNDTRSN